MGIAGTQLVFGGNDVRATDQQLRRQTGPQLSQNRRFIEGCLGGQRAGISAYQQCQGVQLRGASLLKLRQQRLSLVQQGLDLCEIQLRGRADFDAAPENAIGLLAGGHGLPCDRHAFVDLAQAKIAVCHLGDQRQMDGLASRVGSQPSLQGGVFQVADPTPQIQFPGGQTHLGPVLAAHLRSARHVQVARDPRASTLGAHAHGRKTIRALNAECGAGFLDAQRGQAQVAVVLQRSLDEALQQGVGEVRLPGKLSRVGAVGA